MNKTTLGAQELEEALREIFSVPTSRCFEPDTDLSEYVRDSIDLGELLAVIRHRYGICPVRTNLFSEYSRFGDVLAIINNEKDIHK